MIVRWLCLIRLEKDRTETGVLSTGDVPSVVVAHEERICRRYINTQDILRSARHASLRPNNRVERRRPQLSAPA